MQVSVPGARYGEDQQITSFFDRTLERVRALPGVRAAGATQALPLGGGSPVRAFRIEGPTVNNSREHPLAHYRIVTDGYLEAMAIPLRSGRTFTDGDTAGRPLVVLINETLRRTAFGTRDPVGSRVTIGGPSGALAEVVGVVGDVRHFGPGTAAPPEMYWSAAQAGVVPGETVMRMRRSMSLVVSTAEDPITIVPSVRAAVQEVDADQPIASVRTMTSRLGSALWLSRASAWIVSTFGAAAFLFALLGVFGAVSVLGRPAPAGNRPAPRPGSHQLGGASSGSARHDRRGRGRGGWRPDRGTSAATRVCLVDRRCAATRCRHAGGGGHGFRRAGVPGLLAAGAAGVAGRANGRPPVGVIPPVRTNTLNRGWGGRRATPVCAPRLPPPLLRAPATASSRASGAARRPA